MRRKSEKDQSKRPAIARARGGTRTNPPGTQAFFFSLLVGALPKLRSRILILRWWRLSCRGRCRRRCLWLRGRRAGLRRRLSSPKETPDVRHLFPRSYRPCRKDRILETSIPFWREEDKAQSPSKALDLSTPHSIPNFRN